MIIDSPEEAERIVTQVMENIQRAELTEADEADAYHQLSLIGGSGGRDREENRTHEDHRGMRPPSRPSHLMPGPSPRERDGASRKRGSWLSLKGTRRLRWESAIMDEPDQFLHLSQQLRDRRESAGVLAALSS
jgi:ParB family chromosome partitioning protein